MNAEMHIENGKMVFGLRHCSRCFGDGLVAKSIPCRTCLGTGNGKRGGKGQCKKCYGSGREYDHVNKITCPDCNGVNSHACEPATRYDSMPESVWQSLEFRVFRSQRPQTWVEAYLAIGCVYSVTDYGRHQQMTDEQLIETVRTSTGHQACKVTNLDGTVAKYIGIFTSDNGYTPIAVFEQETK